MHSTIHTSVFFSNVHKLVVFCRLYYWIMMKYILWNIHKKSIISVYFLPEILGWQTEVFFFKKKEWIPVMTPFLVLPLFIRFLCQIHFLLFYLFYSILKNKANLTSLVAQQCLVLHSVIFFRRSDGSALQAVSWSVPRMAQEAWEQNAVDTPVVSPPRIPLRFGRSGCSPQSGKYPTWQ